ncbi:hypothetical protein RSO41_13315 [Halomonas sp. I1]|uniref:hypothetical protein n=1 Tax=Halomonas sp. I1 TaxID=393536 RepID=UPI0028DE0380|nr:hypothetical protein [Halomonas sp. I1]MDT8895631.1 hypothetical protein [Halomonas sp. I1]
MRIAIYTEAGFIDRIVDSPDGYEKYQVDQGELYMPVGREVNDISHYVDVSQTPHVARERHRFDSSHEINDLIVEFPELPPGTTVRVQGEELIAEKGVAEIEFDTPGTYTISFQHFQHLDEEVEVTLE